MHLKIIILILILLYMLILKRQNNLVESSGYIKARKKLAVFTAILLIIQSGLRHRIRIITSVILKRIFVCPGV